MAITKNWMTAVPQLERARASGQTFKSVLIQISRPDGKRQIIRLQDVRITSIKRVGQVGMANYFDQITLVYEKIEMEYQPPKTPPTDWSSWCGSFRKSSRMPSS